MWCYNASLDGAGGGFRGQMAKQASKQGLTASLAPHAHFPQRLPAYLNLLEEKLVWGEHQQEQKQRQQQHNHPTLTFPTAFLLILSNKFWLVGQT